MQGRLSPQVGTRVQAFPWKVWEHEFSLAQKLGFCILEWTLDQERLEQNPLMNIDGQKRIKALSQRHKILIPALTGDCFMQAPFWKQKGRCREKLQNDFLSVAVACSLLGISLLVVPLVDEGKIASGAEQKILINFFRDQTRFLKSSKLKIALETDYSPQKTLKLLDPLDPKVFGINYDIGNSASFGYKFQEEFEAYGTRIFHVHVKDRLLGGLSVPLGKGNACFPGVFRGLTELGYDGLYVLQTARACNGKHAEALISYRSKVEQWIQGK